MTEYLETHKKVKRKIEEKRSERDRACVSVKEIAEELSMDIRTVRTHLELMEVDSYGTYLDTNEKYFCPIEGIEETLNRLKRKIENKKLE